MTLGLFSRGLLCLDPFLARLQLRLYESKGSLVTVYLHSLFADETEIQGGNCDPQGATTLRHFREFIECFLDAGYTFITPEHLVEGVDPDRRHLLITFDDGYYNNQRALPLLEQYRVPATFFISAHHVKCGRAFWWDVLHRACQAKGRTAEDHRREAVRLQGMRAAEVDQHLAEHLPGASLRPVSDTDRPFSPEELKKFSANPYVHIGNHTCHHPALPACTEEEAHAEIEGAQDILQAMTGRRPLAIAYPYGSYDATHVRLARAAGLRVGFTVEPRKEYLPQALQPGRILTLGRFLLLGDDCITNQCQFFRSDLMLHERYKRLRHWIRGGRHSETRQPHCSTQSISSLPPR